MNNLEIRHLESFLVLAEEGNFGRAALRLNITQPPLTQRIKELEEILKVSLFDRTTRRVQITAAGRVFLEKVRATMQSLDIAVEASRLTERGVIGRLRVGYTGIASDSVLPQLVSRFGALYPKIALEFVGPCTTGETVLSLLNNETDVALCFLPITDMRLNSRRLTSTDLVLVLPNLHPLARKKSVSVKDVAEEPFVGYPADRGFRLRTAIDTECARAGFRARVVTESRWTQSLLCLVAAGVGVAIVPREQKVRGVAGVVFRSLKPSQLPLDHGIIWRSDDQSPLVASFLAVAQEKFPSGRHSDRRRNPSRP